MGRFDALTTLDTKPARPTPLPEKTEPTTQRANQFTSKPTNQQTSKEVNQQRSKLGSKQTSLPTNQFASKEVKQQISKETNQQTSMEPSQLTTKEKKKYGTYLREDSISAIQMLAVQTKQKDHVVLQEIVD